MKTLSIISVILALSLTLLAQTGSADLVVVNANVHTMNPKQASARSIAVVGNRIVAVGSDAETKAYIGPNTKVIDAGGKLIVPGFNDAHVHFLETGAQLSAVDLRDAKTPAEFVRRIKEFAAKLPKGRWILGGQWDHENWTPN
ncbi:MAG TPA: amidohydrolase family protein, partial [Pyrinomonadaceae bacterium]|nr:amidohydrolase family protein [Pyrinomonadaceae bacterium]